jgi:glycosyltransferase involved in cell wall biosynthesis
MMASSIRPWASVVIPIKDERENLIPLMEQLLKVMESREESRAASFEILFVDDGSTDGSSGLLDQLAEQYPPITAIHLDKNYGKTSALDAGFNQAQGGLIIIMDGDLQTDAADIEILIPYIAQYDLVCGRRAVRQDHIIRKVSSRIANFVRNTVIRDGMHDTGCGFMIFRRAVIEKLPLFEGMHRFFPALALMHGFTVTEVPIRHYARVHGISKYGVGNRLFKGLYDLMAVRWMQSRCLRYRYRQDSLPPLDQPFSKTDSFSATQ